jgi:hypothetical protein
MVFAEEGGLFCGMPFSICRAIFTGRKDGDYNIISTWEDASMQSMVMWATYM